MAWLVLVDGALGARAPQPPPSATYLFENILRASASWDSRSSTRSSMDKQGSELRSLRASPMGNSDAVAIAVAVAVAVGEVEPPSTPSGLSTTSG